MTKRTYRWELRDAAGRLILQDRNLRWRTRHATSVEELCLSTSSGRAGLGLAFDDIAVSR